MSTDDKLDLLLNEMSLMNNRMSSIEGKMSSMEDRMSSIEGKMSSMEDRMSSIEGILPSMESKVSSMENEVKSILLTLENVTNRNIKLIAEGHLDVMRKLEDSLKVSSEKEMLLIRVNTLENEIRLIKERLSHIS